MRKLNALLAISAVGAGAFIGGCGSDTPVSSSTSAATGPTGSSPSSLQTTTTAASTTTTVPERPVDSPVELVRVIEPVDGFAQPASISVDDAHNRLYVVDSVNRRIVAFARDGTDPRVIEADGVPMHFRAEGSLGAVDFDLDGSLFVAESGAGRVLHLTPRGDVLAEFEPVERLGRMFSLSVDRANALIYVVDDVNQAMIVFDTDGNELRRIVTGAGSKPGQTNDIGAIELLDDGSIWVADAGNRRVQHLAPDGSVIQVIGPFDEGDPGSIEYPNDVAVDPNGRIWVADYRGGAVVVYAPDGTPVGQFGGEGDDAYHPNTPVSLTFDDTGRLYLAERHRNVVYVYDVII